MALSTTPKQLGGRNPDGVNVPGIHREVISGEGATRTLKAKESGALCLFDRAAGIVYTLPAPVLGMEFEFRVTTSITSNAAKVITDASTTFLVGSVMAGSLTVADSGDVFQADGTTILAISSNGSTTGGLIGGSFKVTAISSTQWSIEGDVVGSGTLLTPFATS